MTDRLVECSDPLETITDPLWGFMTIGELAWIEQACSLVMPGKILEVGSWLGLSTQVLGRCGPVTCVDTFEGSPELANILSDKPADWLYDTFLANMRDQGVLDNLHILRGDSREILPTLTGPFSFILVDGGHDYDTVLSDLTQSRRLISPGGIIAVDDIRTFTGVIDAVIEIFGEGSLQPVGKLGYWRDPHAR